MDHAGRRDRLRGEFDGLGVEALWVSSLVNVRYLTGFTGSSGQLLVSSDRDRDVLVTDGRYRTQAEAEVPDVDLIITRDGLRDALSRVDVRVGFEGDHVSWSLGLRIQEVAGELDVSAVAVEGAVEELRAVKDADELAVLRRACAITVQGWQHVLDTTQPGMTEHGIAMALGRHLEDLGADGTAFSTIVASGPNSAVPHHQPTDRRIETGDLLKVDFGAKVDGYHADMTRTVAIGEPDPDLRRIHDLVREAQAAGRAAATDGRDIAAVDDACRGLIADAGHGDHFVHPTGHAVGLEIHERPIVTGQTDGSLLPGMTFTVEPGVYLAGRGGVRIEDTIVVTDGPGPEVLTEAPRDLLVL